MQTRLVTRLTINKVRTSWGSVTRTATGSQLFSLLTCFHSTTYTLPSIFSLLEMNSRKIWETPLSCHAKFSLPVAVCDSQKRGALKTTSVTLAPVSFQGNMFEWCSKGPTNTTWKKQKRLIVSWFPYNILSRARMNLVTKYPVLNSRFSHCFCPLIQEHGLTCG